MQEEKIGPLPAHAGRRALRRAAARCGPDPEAVAAAARLLSGAKNPLMLAGRCSRSLDGWNARVALAEKLNMRVLTNLKMAAAFPTDHRLHVGPSANRLSADLQKVLAEADVILSLDWLDLAGTLKQAYGAKPVTAKIIQVSCDAHSHRGWSMDYQALPPVDVYLMCEPEAAVPLLIDAAKARTAGVPPAPEMKLPAASADVLNLRGVSDALKAATQGHRRLLHAPADRLARRLHARSAIRSTISAPKAAAAWARARESRSAPRSR